MPRKTKAATHQEVRGPHDTTNLFMILESEGLPVGPRTNLPNQMLKHGIVKQGPSFLGLCFESCWLQNRICLHLFAAHFCASVWHLFWEASGTNFKDVPITPGSMLTLFLIRLCTHYKTQQMQSVQSKCIFLVVSRLCFCIMFANFLSVCCMFSPGQVGAL